MPLPPELRVEIRKVGDKFHAVTERVRQAGGIPTTAVLHYKPARSKVDLVPDHFVVATDAWPRKRWTNSRFPVLRRRFVAAV